MKKTLSILLLSLLSLTIHATTTVLNTEPVAITWSGACALTADQISNLAVGDVFTITVTEKDATANYPQLHLYTIDASKNTTKLGTTQFNKISDFPHKVSYTLTESDVTTIQANGNLKLWGTGVTVTRFVHQTADEGAPKLTTLWTGETICGDSWASGYLKLTADQLKNASVGDKLIVHVSAISDTDTYPCVALQNGSWKNIDDAPSVLLKSLTAPVDVEFTLTKNMVAMIRGEVDGVNSGLIVKGSGFTFTKVTLSEPNATLFSVLDKDDIKAWEKNETPNVTLTITNNGDEEQTVNIVIKLTSDRKDVKLEFPNTATIASGQTQDVTTDLTLDAGFYAMSAYVNDEKVDETFNIGYDPTGIGTVSTAEPDFWNYWDHQRELLAAVDGLFTIEEELTDLSTANRKVYKVSMMSAPDTYDGDPVKLYAYYAEPVAEGVYPVLVRFQGTDGGQNTPPTINADSNKGWCELLFSHRGQMLNRNEDGTRGYGGDFYRYGIYDMEKHYYRAAYLDCVRAIDFVASREKVNQNQIFVAGGSQGGCFTYVAAGLDSRIRAIAPSITGHADFPNTMLVANWPTNVFKDEQTKQGVSDEDRDKFLSYFDTMNFASRITCPVISNFSLQDTTDPTRLNLAPYNLLVNVADEDKSYSINPFLGHSTRSDWGTMYMNFFNQYMTAPETISASVGQAGMATFSSSRPLDFSEVSNVKAYVISDMENGVAKTLRVSGTVAGGTGLLLVADGAQTVDIPVITRGDNYTQNLLRPALGNTTVESSADGIFNYILSHSKGDISDLGFYLLESSATLTAGKAYLQSKEGLPADAAQAKVLLADGEATDIAGVEHAKGTGTIYYNLLGMPTNSPSHGIYIVNGKKVVVK